MGDVDTSSLSSAIPIVRVPGADAVARCASPQFAPYAADLPINAQGQRAGEVGIALVSSESFPDGLAAAAHASHRNLRVVLVPRATLTPEVRAEINRLKAYESGAPRWDNIIYGGPAAISEDVMRAVNA
jgi:putative cell wall-binding protein